MRAEPGGVIFDLDDTLYPQRRFRLSGFAEVAAHLDRYWGVPARDAFRRLVGAMRTAPGRELQALADGVGLPAWIVPQLVVLIRSHRPRLRLPLTAARVLDELSERWVVGIVTGGPASLQQRKIEALGLAARVDVIVCADACGAPKPAAAPFLVAARRLGVPPDRIVVVGHDAAADVAGARAAGMFAVRVACRDEVLWEPSGSAHVVVRSLAEVPSAAGRLLDGQWRAHAG